MTWVKEWIMGRKQIEDNLFEKKKI
jgi:hypothetical protein